MPTYEYEHLNKSCDLGKVFDYFQFFKDEALTKCPKCGEPVQRLISRPNLVLTKTNAELRDLGFTKLVKRDDGVYENVTARDGESRYVQRDKPETLPNLSKTITD